MKAIKLKQDMEKKHKHNWKYNEAKATLYPNGLKSWIVYRFCIKCLQGEEVELQTKKCTCKIDKEGNLTIDKKCYWHGK